MRPGLFLRLLEGARPIHPPATRINRSASMEPGARGASTADRRFAAELLPEDWRHAAAKERRLERKYAFAIRRGIQNQRNCGLRSLDLQNRKHPNNDSHGDLSDDRS